MVWIVKRSERRKKNMRCLLTTLLKLFLKIYIFKKKLKYINGFFVKKKNFIYNTNFLISL